MTCGLEGSVAFGGADSRHRLSNREPGKRPAGDVEAVEAADVRDALTLELLAVSNPRDGRTPHGAPSVVAPPSKLVFATDLGLWDHESLGEELLIHLQMAERTARALTWGNREGVGDADAEDLVALLQTQIRNGHVGLAEFTKIASEAATRKMRLRDALYLANGLSLSEDVRGALLRACHHSVAMIRAVRQVNETQDVRLVVREPRQPVLEMEHFSALIDAVASEFASSVSSAYTTLDVLYKWFAYFTRVTEDPDPDLPGGLHFPDAHPERSAKTAGGLRPEDHTAAELPMALPFIPQNYFSALRNARDAVVHDMAPDAVRANMFIGRGGPRVGGVDLQYAQYLTRDVHPNGTPVAHRWVRRFYRQQRDAQHVLHAWLEGVWQAAFDTVDWVRCRLDSRARAAGLS